MPRRTHREVVFNGICDFLRSNSTHPQQPKLRLYALHRMVKKPQNRISQIDNRGLNRFPKLAQPQDCARRQAWRRGSTPRPQGGHVFVRASGQCLCQLGRGQMVAARPRPPKASKALYLESRHLIARLQNMEVTLFAPCSHKPLAPNYKPMCPEVLPARSEQPARVEAIGPKAAGLAPRRNMTQPFDVSTPSNVPPPSPRKK